MNGTVSSRWPRGALGIPVRWLASGLRSAAALVEIAVPTTPPAPRPFQSNASQRAPLPYEPPAPGRGRAPVSDRRDSRDAGLERGRDTETTPPLRPDHRAAVTETMFRIVARSPDSAFAFWEFAPESCEDSPAQGKALRVRAEFADGKERIIPLAPRAHSHYLSGLPAEGWVRVCLGSATETEFQPLTDEKSLQMPPGIAEPGREESPA